MYQQVVVTKLMPMNNATGLTEEERGLVCAVVQERCAPRWTEAPTLRRCACRTPQGGIALGRPICGTSALKYAQGFPIHGSTLTMKTRAAVAWKAGQPLTIETVDLQGPKFGEVLVEIKATGICHTDYYTLSAAPTPRGCFPPSWATKARASWWTWARA